MFINFIGQLLFKIKFTCHNSSVSVVFHVKGFDLHARYFRVQYMVTVHRDQGSSFHSVIPSLCAHLLGMVLGFNVVLSKSYESFARHREVQVVTNRVIYRLLQQLKVSSW